MYLDCSRYIYKIIGCNHYIHKECFDTAYGGEDKLIIYCDWCNLYSNLQLDQLEPKFSVEKDENQLKLIKKVSLHTGIKEMYKFLDRTQKAVVPNLVGKLKDSEQPAQDEFLSIEEKLV